MSSHYDKLISKLRELFELDKADLDFGIYRIIAQRQTEITQFLEHDLKRSVQSILQDGEADHRDSLQRELDDAVKSMQDLGMEPSASPKVKELTEKLSAYSGSENQEIQTYEHLYRFFSRYYEEGDFISQRRVSKDAKYAIPYNGEEVKLHWSNADQYYIKSSENFRDYRFKLADGRFVIFKLQEAQSSQDNTKGDKRYFRLSEESIIKLDTGELQIGFTYQGLASDEKKITGADGKEKTTNQKVLNELALQGIQEELNDEWKAQAFAAAPTKANPKRTLIEKHLNDYTAKNTFDYFIHKDLNGFLSRELDFYIKNEVMELDDVVQANDNKLGEMLQKIRAIRQVTKLVISFLAQIENFQRKLWLKKKFVVKSDYCFTVDRLPQSLYSTIADNLEQHKEWSDLGFIPDDEMVTTDFLRMNPFLLVDTKFFATEFKYDCLAAIDDIDQLCNGLLIHGDNFQALNLLKERYREKVKCIYIDPPYNTGGDGFAYKDNYQHSSWMSMLSNRTEAALALSGAQTSFYSSIDDHESGHLRELYDSKFGADNFVANIIWQKKYAPQNDAKWFSDDHDFLLAYAVHRADWRPEKLPRTEKQNKGYKNADNDHRGEWMSGDYTSNKSAIERPNLYYSITNPTTSEEILPNKNAVWRYTKDQHKKNEADNRVWWGSEGTNSTPRFKRFLSEVGGMVPRTLWQYEEVGHNQDGIRQVRNLFPDTSFTSPKPTGLISKVIRIAGKGITLDYFAGSGTTAHAVINLNREDEGDRKYILVEQGEYFDTVLKPRVKKVAHAEHWKDGKPIVHKDHQGSENTLNGISHCFKTLTLESYEDTQNNLELNRSQQQQDLLDAEPSFNQDYTLNYMLDMESKGSLLNIQAFEQPFNYQMKIATDSAGETSLQNVDLIETFNYLIGLTVQTLEKITVHIPFQRDNDGIWQTPDKIKPCEVDTPESYTFLIISGQLPNEDSTLVIWRVLNDFANPESKMFHNMALDTFVMDRLRINPRDKEIDAIFVNGDNTLPNIRSGEEHWKGRLIEEEFQRLMFAEA